MDDGRTTDGRTTDAGVTGIQIAHLGAFGSGELKNIQLHTIIWGPGIYICFGCLEELSHLDCSFEYPQHMFWLRNKKNNLKWRPV